MRQYFSIFALSARSTLFKLLGIIALMGAAEIAMFYFAMDKESYGILLEELMQQSKVQIAFGIGFILYYTVLIGGFNGKHPSKSAMTTSRLGIKESSVSWIIAIYNMCTLIIFLTAQLGIVLIMCKMYLSSDLAGDYQHTLFIAFYRNGMMHGLLPLEDYGVYIENAIYIVSLGICASCTSMKQRKGKSDFSAILAAVIVALSFCGRANYFTIFGYRLVVIFFSTYGAYYISKGGATDEDEDETAAPELA